MPKKTAGTALLIVAIAAVATALVTLLPAQALHKNDLGYFSLCPFAPWSTLALLFVAGIIWMVRGYLLSRVD